MNTLMTLVLLAVPSTGVEVTEEAAAKNVLVLDLEAKTADEGVDGLVRDEVAADLSRRPELNVMTSADVRRIAGLEAARQASGCDEESACLVELGEAMGAELIVYGSVGKFGALHVVNLNLFNAKSGVSLSRINIKTKHLQELPRLIEGALAEHLGPVEARAAPEPWSAEGAPTLTGFGWGTVAVGGAAIVVGGVLAALGELTLGDEGSLRRAKDDATDYGIAGLWVAGAGAGVAAIGGLMVLLGGE